MFKNHTRLFTPGPLNTLPLVKSAMNIDIGTRTKTLVDLTKNLRVELEDIASCGDDYTCVLLQGSGTYAVEAMITTLIPPDGIVLVVCNGVYAERMAKICHIHQIKHVILDRDHTQRIEINAVQEALIADKRITHILAVHFETNFGVLNDIDALVHLAAQYNCQVLVDAMSSFGVLPLKYDPALIAVAASSNKCLHGTPGISFVVARKQVLLQSSHQRTLSLDLQAQWQGFEENGQWRFTPPTHILLALWEAILQFKIAGGLLGRLEKYTRLTRQLIDGLASIDIHPVIDEHSRAPMITTFILGETCQINSDELYERLFARGLVIYPSNFKDKKSFRVGCIGEIDTDDINELIDAIKEIRYDE
ncbi:MAG: 2-aminoethylphosphonate--pyruvate transaminase [Tatlockia sp.]|nr:2-aminoethylphosphonate--pyruvate transaminase [Tatlockia sp.]